MRLGPNGKIAPRAAVALDKDERSGFQASLNSLAPPRTVPPRLIDRPPVPIIGFSEPRISRGPLSLDSQDQSNPLLF